MRSRDRTRCPQCGGHVSSFAAGCAICGADLDIRRFDRPQLWRPSQNPWIARGVVVTVVALFVYLAATRTDRLSSPNLPTRRQAQAPIPRDAKRVIDTVTGGAAPAAQRAALKRYLAARHVGATPIASIMRHSRDGVGLVESKTATGTRIGGPGLVPAGQDWPRSPAGYPLDFIALIDFAELPHVGPLPRAGRLALYYGGNPDDPQFADPVAAARAYYFPPGTPTASPKAPTDTYPIAAFHVRGRLMSLSGDSEQVVEDTKGDRAKHRLIDAMNDVTTADLQPSHLLGTPFAVQGPPLGELVYDLSGKTEGVLPASIADYSKAERRDPRVWVLLAEIGEQGGLTIADGGALYYAIPRRDLAIGRFDRVAVIMQSH
jgi:Domain of unknown function (DUF1963)